MNPPQIIDRGRGPELAGTRFTVFDIIPMWKKGRPAQYIAAIYGLSEVEVAVLIQYIEAHKDELMPINDEIEAWVARGNSPEVAAKIEASVGKARARQDELRRKREQEGNTTSANSALTLDRRCGQAVRAMASRRQEKPARS